MQMSKKRKRSPADAPSESFFPANSNHPAAAESPAKKKKKVQRSSSKKQPVTGVILKPTNIPKNFQRHPRNKANKKKKPLSKAKNNTVDKKEGERKSDTTVGDDNKSEVKSNELPDGNSEVKKVDSGKAKKPKRNRKKAKGTANVTLNGGQPVNDSKRDVKKTLKPKKKKRMAEASTANPSNSFPQTPEEISSNWKQLKATLEVEKKKKGKKVIGSKVNRSKTKVPSSPKPTEPEIWFDDVDDTLIHTLKKSEEAKMKTSQLQNAGPEGESKETKHNPLVKEDTFKGLTKCVAMDCEMVGVGDGKDSILARVSLVNHYGYQVYDKFVKPREKVTDYRTYVSGIRPEHLENAEEFLVVQKEVADIINDRVLVGHALHNDLKVLYLTHPRRNTRDTSAFKPFRHLTGGRTPSLKKLTEKLLGVQVQAGEHSSVEDAQAAMRLYTMHRKEWERYIKEQRFKKSTTKPMGTELTVKTKPETVP